MVHSFITTMGVNLEIGKQVAWANQIAYAFMQTNHIQEIIF